MARRAYALVSFGAGVTGVLLTRGALSARTSLALGMPSMLSSGAIHAGARPASRLLLDSRVYSSSSESASESAYGSSSSGGSSASGSSRASASRARAVVALGLAAATGMTATAAAEGSVPLPPVAPRRPHIVKVGKVEGEDRGKEAFDPPKEVVDELYWLRDDKRENPEVLAHLRAENAYAEAMTSHLQTFRARIYDELLSHVQETDDSAPYPYGPFECAPRAARAVEREARVGARGGADRRSALHPLRGRYYTRTIEGLSYVIHCRKPKGASKAREQVLLDENELAKQHPDHCDVGAVEVSPSHALIGYSLDGKGYETYSIHFKQLSAGGAHLPDVLEETSGDLVWGGDDRTVYYTKFDEAHRPNSVWRHALGTEQKDDVKLYEDTDGLFYVSLGKSRDGRLLLVQSHSSETSEVHLLELLSAKGKPIDSAAHATAPSALRVVEPRQHKLRYSVAHRNDWLYITTNEGDCHNQKVVVAPLSSPGRVHWKPIADCKGLPVLPHDLSRTISHAAAFQDHVVLSGREAGLTQVWVLEMGGAGPCVGSWHRIEWPDAAYECGLGPNEEFASRSLRLAYSSPIKPRRAISYDMSTRRSTVLKETPVPNYDPALYATARREFWARDGTMVPVTLLWRKDKVKVALPESATGAPVEPAPVHLYGYGSYGMSVEPAFSSRVLPLIDRGIVYAIAHVRGGSENGRWQWYEENGKYLSKRNTFNDFVDVASALVGSGWTTPGQMSCEGRSAGGLLVGNVLNLAPQLFRAAIAGVPFVDLVVTMCDPSIPLTIGEWAEWGNPVRARCVGA